MKMDNKAERMKVAASYRQSAMILHRDPLMRQLSALKEDCQEKGVPESVIEGINKAMDLFMARENYCEEISSAPSEALTKLAADTMSHPWAEVHAQGKTKWNLDPRMVSGAHEGQFLQHVVSMTKAKRVLEIGMFTGYAALACAEVLPEDGEVVTCEFDPYLEGVARGFFSRSPHGKKIEIKIGPASDTLVQLAREKQKFDLVFIDANKDGYLGYYKAVMDNGMLNDDGTLVFDNALRGGHPYLDETTEESQPAGWAIKKCNEYVSADPRVRCVMVPIRDGVFLVRRKEAFSRAT